MQALVRSFRVLPRHLPRVTAQTSVFTQRYTFGTLLKKRKHPFIQEEKELLASTAEKVGKDVKVVAEDTVHLVKDVLGGAAHVVGETVENILLRTTRHLPVNYNHVHETCIPGVYTVRSVHNQLEDLFDSHFANEIKVVGGSGTLLPKFHKMIGTPMTDEAYAKVYAETAKVIGIEEDSPCDFAPLKLDFAQLKNLITHNAFVASGLSYEDGGVCFNATKDSANPITKVIMEALPDTFTTTKLWLNTDMTEMKLIVGDQAYSPEDPEFDLNLRQFITSLLYFFEVKHACLHVYAYLMLEAATMATVGTELESFMDQYRMKVFIKYQEVAILLLKPKTGHLVGGFFDADQDKAYKACLEVFSSFAAQTTAQDFYQNVMCGGVPQVYNNRKILPETQQYYIHLMTDLANNVADKVPDGVMADIGNGIEKYFLHTAGKDKIGYFNMDTFEEWLQCQGMMGILHGNTLGISRLILSKYCRPGGEFDATDFPKSWGQAPITVGTLLGLEEEHAILQEKPVANTIFKDVFTQYQAEIDDHQATFWSKIDPEDKKLFGWITSVWGPNMVDKTQLTTTTYV